MENAPNLAGKNAVQAIAVTLAIAVMVGCAPVKREVPMAKVAGKVTLDGNLLEDGGITFVPTTSGQGPSVWAKIENGIYLAPAVPLGDLLVRIHATRLTGRKIEVDGVKTDERVSAVDERFRQGVALTVERNRDDQNFDLTSSK